MSTYPRAQGPPEKPWGRGGADGRPSRAGRPAGQGRRAGLQGWVALPFGRAGSEPRRLRAPLLRPLLPCLRRSSRRSLPAWQLAKPLPCASGFHPPPPDARAGARVQRAGARGESPGAPGSPATAASAVPVLRPGLPRQVPPRNSRECCPGPAAKRLLALKAGCSRGSLSWLPAFPLSPAATLLRAQAWAEMPGGDLMLDHFLLFRQSTPLHDGTR